MPGANDTLLAPKELRRRLKISERTFRRWEANNILPPPDFLVEGAKRWWLSEIDHWIRMNSPKAEKQKAANPAKRGQTRPNPATAENEP